ncbi:hypothetical protein ABPG74_001676 [Tetrahymena malaccensis]
MAINFKDLIILAIKINILFYFRLVNSQQCDDNSYYDISLGQCNTCSNLCGKCFGVSSRECIQCPQDYIYFTETFTCQRDDTKSQARINGISLACNVSHCQQCYDLDVCLKCDDGYLLNQQGKCTSQCLGDLIESVEGCIFSCQTTQDFEDVSTGTCEFIQNCPTFYQISEQCLQSVILYVQVISSHLFVFDNQAQIQIYYLPDLIFYTQISLDIKNEILAYYEVQDYEIIIIITASTVYYLDLVNYDIQLSQTFPSPITNIDFQLIGMNYIIWRTPLNGNLKLYSTQLIQFSSVQLNEVDQVFTVWSDYFNGFFDFENNSTLIFIHVDESAFLQIYNSTIDKISNENIQDIFSIKNYLMFIFQSCNICIHQFSYSQKNISAYLKQIYCFVSDTLCYNTSKLYNQDWVLTQENSQIYNQFQLYTIQNSTLINIFTVEANYFLESFYNTNYLMFVKDDSIQIYDLSRKIDEMVIQVFQTQYLPTFNQIFYGYYQESIKQFDYIIYQSDSKIIYVSESEVYYYKCFQPIQQIQWGQHLNDQFSTNNKDNCDGSLLSGSLIQSTRSRNFGNVNCLGVLQMFDSDTNIFINSINLSIDGQIFKQVYNTQYKKLKEIYSVLVTDQNILFVVFDDTDYFIKQQIQVCSSVDYANLSYNLIEALDTYIIILNYNDQSFCLYSIILATEKKVNTNCQQDSIYFKQTVYEQEQFIVVSDPFQKIIIYDFNLNKIASFNTDYSQQIILYYINSNNKSVKLIQPNCYTEYGIQNQQIISQFSFNVNVTSAFSYYNSYFLITQVQNQLQLYNTDLARLIYAINLKNGQNLTSLQFVNDKIALLILNSNKLIVLDCSNLKIIERVFNWNLAQIKNIFDSYLAISFFQQGFALYDYTQNIILFQNQIFSQYISQFGDQTFISANVFQDNRSLIFYGKSGQLRQFTNPAKFLFRVRTFQLGDEFDGQIFSCFYKIELNILIAQINSNIIITDLESNLILSNTTLASLDNQIQETIYIEKFNKIVFLSMNSMYLIDILKNYNINNSISNKIIVSNFYFSKNWIAFLELQKDDDYKNYLCLYDVQYELVIWCQEYKLNQNYVVEQLRIQNQEIIIVKNQFFLQIISIDSKSIVFEQQYDFQISQINCNEYLNTCVYNDAQQIVYILNYSDLQRIVVSNIYELQTFQTQLTNISFDIVKKYVYLSGNLNFIVRVTTIGNQSFIISVKDQIAFEMLINDLNQKILYFNSLQQLCIFNLDDFSQSLVRIDVFESTEIQFKQTIFYKEKYILFILVQQFIHVVSIGSQPDVKFRFSLKSQFISWEIDKLRQLLIVIEVNNIEIFNIQDMSLQRETSALPEAIQNYGFNYQNYNILVDILQKVLFLYDQTDAQVKKTIEFAYLFNSKNQYLSNAIFAGVQYQRSDQSLQFYMLMSSLIIQVNYNNSTFSFQKIYQQYSFYSEKVEYGLEINRVIFFDFKKYAIFMLDTIQNKITMLVQIDQNNFVRFLQVNEDYTQVYFADINNQIRMWDVIQQKEIPYKYRIDCLINTTYYSKSLFKQQELTQYTQLITNDQFPEQLMIWTWAEQNTTVSWLSIIMINDTSSSESVHIVFYNKIIENLYWNSYGNFSNYTYVLFKNDFNIKVLDLSQGQTFEKLIEQVQIATLIKPCISNSQIVFTTYYIAIWCSVNINFYLRQNHQFITSYSYFMESMRIIRILNQLDHYFFVILNGEIQLIEIDYMNQLQQVRLLWQLNTDYHYIVQLQLFSIYQTLDIQIIMMKYGQVQSLEFYINNNFNYVYKRVDSYNGFCSYLFTKENDSFSNLVNQYMMEIGAQIYIQKIQSLLITYDSDSMLHIPYVSDYIRTEGFQTRIISRYSNNDGIVLTIPLTQINLNFTSILEIKQVILSLLQIRHYQFYLSLLQLIFLQKVNFQDIKFEKNDIINTSFYIQNIESFSLQNLSIVGIDNILSPNGLFRLDNIQNVYIDTLIISNITMLSLTPIIKFDSCPYIQISNLIINQTIISQEDQDFKNIMQNQPDGEIYKDNYLFYHNDISDLQPNSTNNNLFSFINCQIVNISNVNIVKNIWKNGTNLFNFQQIDQLILNNVNISGNIINNFYQTIENVQQQYFNPQPFTYNDDFNESKQQLHDKYIQGNYKNLDLSLEYLKGFISISLTNTALINNLTISSNSLQTNEFSFIQVTQCNLTSINDLFVENVQQIATTPAILLKIQGIRHFKLDSFDFSNNLNIKVAYVQEISISSAQSAINLYVQLQNIRLSNSNCRQSFFQMIVFNIDISNGSFMNLENTQSKQDILKLYSTADSIFYQRIPTGVISIFNFNKATIDNLSFMSCKAYFSPTLYFNQGQYLSISNSEFVANISYERAGALVITNLLSSDILDSQFISNMSQTSYGGAIIIYKSTINSITNCTLSKNKALSDSGGAIIIISSDVKILKDNSFNQNQAAIGGAIRLIQCLPSFVNKKRDYRILNNFNNNTASLYGNDLSYNPQGLAIVDPKDPNKLIYDNYVLLSQESGSQIKPALKVVIIDEDFKPIKFPTQLNPQANSTNSQQQVQEDQNVITQYSLYQLSIMSIDNNVLQLQGTNLSNFDFEENAYVFNIIALAKPLAQSQLKIQTTIPFDVIDLNTKKIQQKTLSLAITVQFRNCIRGEIPTIQNQQFISCDKCPSGKYSIAEVLYNPSQNQQSFSQYSCKICPQQAKFCEGDIIQVKNGYWRWGNHTDNIFYCTKYPQNCIPEDPNNKFGCQKGTIGVQCSECDLRGGVWEKKYGRLNTNECQDCEMSSSWSYILILIVEVLIMLFYQAYQINKQRIFALKQCAYKCLRLTHFLVMGKSELIDQGSVYLKMYVNYAQIMVVFRSFQFNILPNFIFSIFSIFGGDSFSLSFLNIDCFISSLILSLPVYMNKFIYTLTYPFIFFVANAMLRMFFSTPQGLIISLKSQNYLTNIKCRLSQVEKQKQSQIFNKMKQFIVNNLPDLKSNFIFLYFFYAPIVIKTILSYIICQNIDGKSVLIGDQSQFCSIDNHQLYLVTYIVPVFIIWIFLIPAGLLLILFLNRHFLSWMYMKRAYGYIYQEYRSSIYYWEFIKIYLKILIISSQIVLNQDIRLQQMYILSSLFLYFLATKQVKPYSSTDMNQCDQNFTIVLIFNVLLFCISEQINSQIYIKYTLQTLLFIVNISIIIFIAKRTFLTKFPYSYFKMNIFQKIIFKLCNRFPKLYRYIEFQPQDPYRVFRNWKKLRQLLQQFYNLKKSKNFLNEQMYKLYKTQINIGSCNTLESTSNRKISQRKKSKQNTQIKPINSFSSINKNKFYEQMKRQQNSKQFSIKLMEDSIQEMEIYSQQEPISINQKIYSSQTLTQTKMQSINSQIQNNNSDVMFFKQKTNKEYNAKKERRKSHFSVKNQI